MTQNCWAVLRAATLGAIAVVLLMAPTIVVAQGVTSVDSVIIVDANGKKVGALRGQTEKNFPSVDLLLPDGSIVAVGVRPEGFDQSTGPSFPLYASTDCTGTPYVDAFSYFDVYSQTAPLALSRSTIVPSALVAPPGNTLWEPDLSNVTTNFSPVSVNCGSGVGCVAYAGSGCGSPFPSGSYVPFRAILDLNALFTPPFHAAAGSSTTAAECCGDCNGNGAVTIDEIITGVNNALSGCPVH